MAKSKAVKAELVVAEPMKIVTQEMTLTNFLSKDESLIIIEDRATAKLNLENLVKEHEVRFNVLNKKTTFTEEEFKEVCRIEKLLRDTRLMIDNLDDHNNKLWNKAKKKDAAQNLELSEIVKPNEEKWKVLKQAQIDRDEIEKQRLIDEKIEKDNAIKQSIVDLEGSCDISIEALTFENIDEIKKEIGDSLLEKIGTFGEFELDFEAAMERINLKLDQAIKDANSAHETSENERIRDIDDKIKEIERKGI